jgi:CRISPR/Cas system endoribonuclease Cas6 (RAMP superfamily)
VDTIGRGRRRVALQRIDAVHPLTGVCKVVYTADENLVRPREASLTLADCGALPCPEGPVRVTFTTQTRLKQGGAFARRPGFQLLFRRLLGRLSALARFHDKVPLDVDFRGLIDAAGAVRLTRAETRWTRWARYSARQDRRMEWEGLVGTAVYEGDLAPFWPYLVFGQWTHVGSSTTFGLGRYIIEPVAAGDRAAEARG